MDKRVAILMSTYNGEKYLTEQIESIVNQSFPNWVLYIRDDGSTDKTTEIIKKFTRKYSNIIFFNEDNIKNVGIVKSFIYLLENVSADYYMFSDQDDVWLKNKVQDSVELANRNNTTPLCIFSDLEIVTQDLHPVRRMNGSNVWTSFTKLLFTNCVTGCTMLFNDKLKRLIKFSELDFDLIYMHDWWIGLLAALFGKVIYLNEATILYRQHGDNVVGGTEKDTLQHDLYRITNLNPERAQAKRIVNVSYELNREYGDKVKGKQAEYIAKYGNLRKTSSFWGNLRLVNHLTPQRINLKGKLFFSCLFIVYHKDFIE